MSLYFGVALLLDTSTFLLSHGLGISFIFVIILYFGPGAFLWRGLRGSSVCVLLIRSLQKTGQFLASENPIVACLLIGLLLGFVCGRSEASLARAVHFNILAPLVITALPDVG